MKMPLLQLKRDHIWATCRLGLPLVGANLAEIAIHATDTLMLGWLGVPELAAGTLGAQLYFVIFILGLGIAHAIVPMIAQAHGRDDRPKVRMTVRMGIWGVLLYGLCTLPIFFFSKPIFMALHQNEEVLGLADQYLRIAGLAIFPALLFQVFRSFLSAVEFTGAILQATILGVLFNALCNYMLIFGNWGAPALGVEGAAIASVLSSSLMALYMIGHCVLLRRYHAYQLFRRFWALDWGVLRETARLGLPISLSLLAEVGLFSASTIMAGWLGTVGQAAHGVALQIASVSFMVPLGLSAVATVRVGQRLGRQDRADMIAAGHAVFFVVTIYTLLAALFIMLFSAELVALFIGSDAAHGAELVAVAVPMLVIASCFQFSDGLQVAAMSGLRGLKDTKIPMWIAVICYWPVGLSASYYLGFVREWGGAGIWAGLLIGLSAAAVLLLWRFEHQLREIPLHS